jgi:hypothetical protein
MELKRLCSALGQGLPKDVEKEHSEKIYAHLRSLTRESTKVLGEEHTLLKGSIANFTKEPTTNNVIAVKEESLNFLSRRNIEMKGKSRRFVDDLSTAYGHFASGHLFKEAEILIKAQIWLVHKLFIFLLHKIGLIFAILHSTFSTTEKGLELFGRHYLKEIKGIK